MRAGIASIVDSDFDVYGYGDRDCEIVKSSTAHCFKVSYRTFLSGKLPVFIVTAPNFQNMSAIPLSLMGYLGIHLKSCYMP